MLVESERHPRIIAALYHVQVEERVSLRALESGWGAKAMRCRR